MADVMIWLVVIVGLAVVLGVVAVIIRRRSLGDTGPSIGFTLADLRAMHESGEISDEEFATAKARMLGTAKAELAESEEARTPAPDQSEDDFD